MTTLPPRTFPLAELGEMAKIAQAATEGPWTIEDSSIVHRRDSDNDWDIAEVYKQYNRAHIARFDPPTALALIAQLQAATRTIIDRELADEQDEEWCALNAEIADLRAQLATARAERDEAGADHRHRTQDVRDRDKEIAALRAHGDSEMRRLKYDLSIANTAYAKLYEEAHELRAQLATTKEALGPFAKFADNFDDKYSDGTTVWDDEDIAIRDNVRQLVVGAYRDARAALAALAKAEKPE